MSVHPRPRGATALAAAAVAVALAASAAPAAPTMPSAADPDPDGARGAAAGLQVAPKGPSAALRGAANPYTALVPDLAAVDFAAWRERLAAAGRQRAGSPGLARARRLANARTPAAAAAFLHDEEEPAGTAGSNDTPATAEPIGDFGTGAGLTNAVRIAGEKALMPRPEVRPLRRGAEDNGSIPRATRSGLRASSAVATGGVLGDGPHGGPRGSNDFDFYQVSLVAGQTLTVRTSSPIKRPTDTVIALYAATGGAPIVVDDDSGYRDLSSQFSHRVTTSGSYYVLVAGFADSGTLPADPRRSGSGAGGADRGNYRVRMTQALQDVDHYAVNLEAGDVLGGVTGGRANSLTVFRPDGTAMVGSKQLDASSLYAPESPLPGGGTTTVAYVAEEAGWYAVEVDGGTGSYTVQLEAYRPGAETDTDQTQTVLLDFEGGRVNTAIWGGGGVRELSPFSAFVTRWGIARDREQALIDQITTEVEEHLEAEVADGGLNPGLQVEVVTTRTDPELRGAENVSRIIVGGTIEESGIPTIGIAQYIDPGNYGHEDTGLVLLDILSSSDPQEPASLNGYLTSASDREQFVSRAVANITAHEIGHMVGGYHTDNQSPTTNLMDQGGFNFQNLFGVGPDGVGGTDDDPDVEFVEDVYAANEGFTGIEDTENVVAWAYPGAPG